MSEFPEVTYARTFGMMPIEKRPDLIVKVWDQDRPELGATAEQVRVA